MRGIGFVSFGLPRRKKTGLEKSAQVWVGLPSEKLLSFRLQRKVTTVTTPPHYCLSHCPIRSGSGTCALIGNDYLLGIRLAVETLPFNKTARPSSCDHLAVMMGRDRHESISLKGLPRPVNIVDFVGAVGCHRRTGTNNLATGSGPVFLLL
ncbi:hypothetical protein PISMIDRAFT_675113 [Pisolithus microcarpus 441]|uniref:Uncharacterized protein n=1 Tax=Pisolithus microcarpus 441 TaxID=765257 RepID=A0A0C9ZMV4_9AGAM|nr:hypothetical protein PISMIDRAFT_675113 [Pisolithus microcarpus 441]